MPANISSNNGIKERSTVIIVIWSVIFVVIIAMILIQSGVVDPVIMYLMKRR